MRDERIYLKIETLSNMFIGGAPATFEIGGIDLHTITDYEGNPYIPASTIKGKMRSILKEIIESRDDSGAKRVEEQYKFYLSKIYEENKKKMETANIDEEKKDEVNEKIGEVIDKVSAEYLFGIEGFNHTPKLIFNDLKLKRSPNENSDNERFFSYDTKNNISVDEKNIKIYANPRSYKAVRPNVVFEGYILFYNVEKLAIEMKVIQELLIKVCEEFNTGIYRIGNSGSRGYGKVHVTAKIERVSCGY